MSWSDASSSEFIDPEMETLDERKVVVPIDCRIGDGSEDVWKAGRWKMEKKGVAMGKGDFRTA